MSVKYRKVVNNRKNSKTKGKVYGRAVVDGVIDTKEIAGKISKRCTLTEPDIIAVINALETEIGYGLADGKRVVLDGFGSFKVGLTTTPADAPRSSPVPTSRACTSSSCLPPRWNRASA